MMKLEDFSEQFSLNTIPGYSVPFLAGVLADPSKYYRFFYIPKRRGGVRRIDAPYPVLSEIQRRIVDRLAERYSISESAFAYVAGRNTVQHALHHVGQDELLLVDINDFFGSVTRQAIFQSLEAQSEFSTCTHAIALICTLNGVLPQGAPSSPFLSNLAFKAFDYRLGRLASRLNLVYSRYADDLAFSGQMIPRNFPSYLNRLLSSGGYSLNFKKTTLKVKGAKKIITGVSISSGEVKAPRSFVRDLRARIHYIERRMGQVSSGPVLDPLVYERAIGRLNYLLQIEPANQYALRKKASLSQQHRRFLALSASFNEDSY